MYEYTENNYLKFGYESGYFKSRDSSNETFIVEHGRCTHNPGSFKDECLIAAQKIYESTDLPINIMFSGGIDGEVAVQTFKQLKIPFKVSIMKFKNNLNLHDISFAITFCEQHNVKYDLIELDLLKFLETDMYEYAEKTQCWHPTLLPIMWLTDQTDDFPIITSGEITLKKQIPDNYIPGVSPYEDNLWNVCYKELIHSFVLHFMIQDRPGIPKFFEYTPEMIYSFLKDSIVEDLINNKRIGKLGLVSSKYYVYANYYDLAFRLKYTGFEKLKEIESEYENKLKTLYGYCNGVYEIEYNDLLKKLKYDG